MGKTVFDLNNSKTIFLSLSLFFAAEKSKNTFPPVAGSKNVIFRNFVSGF